MQLSRSIIALLVLCLLAACGAGPSATKQEGPLVVGTNAPVAVAPASATPEGDAALPIGADDAIEGNRLALVTLVVFSDFECPFCARLEASIDRLREEYGEQLRVVFKHNPLPFHTHARLAAEVSQGVLALGGQAAFRRFVALAFRFQPQMSAETIRSWAVQAGVDARALEAGLEAKRWAGKVDADLALAKRLEVTGTPISFVNGVMISGAQPYAAFKEKVDVELEKASSLVARGVAREKVYGRLVEANLKGSHEEEDDASAAAEAKIIHKVPAGSGPVRGPATALVTIVAFSDFQCPFCKRGAETLEQIRREYGDKVRVLWRDMPLSFHQRAEPAAELARAARAQKGDAGFWAVHDLLFASQPNLEDSDFERIAREAKLDVAKATAAVKAKSFTKAIYDDAEVGDDFQANGTPHFFVNGRRIVGAKPLSAFKPVIDEEIARAEGLVRGGIAMTDLYDALVKDGKTPPEPLKKAIAAAPTGAPFRGAPNAKVVIHEVGDFQCPFCKRADATVEELLKAYPGTIKVVWRDKPLSMHPDAPLAAEAAREAYAQKGNAGFTKMHKLLFDHQDALTRPDLETYAKTAGLDVARFARALDARTHKAAVDADAKAANDAGVSGTPAFFVGPYVVSGAAPYSKLRKLVELTLRPPSPERGSAPAVVR